MKNLRRLSILAALLCLALVWGLSAPALAEEPPLTLTVEYEEETVSIDEGDANNDALLDAYVQRMIDASLNRPAPQLRSSLVGESLDGVDKAVYDILKTAVSEIAAGGPRTSSIIDITEQDLKGKGINIGPWTASQLGVSAIVEGNSISSAAKNAAKAKMSFDFSKVLNALLADCPYELYWYNKTLTTNCGFSYGFGADWDYGRQEYLLSLTETITIRMPVSQGYAGADSYTVDNTRIETVRTAIQNAQNIVKASTGTVYDRLLYYKNAICDRVSYNSSAAGGGASYGDPWQLIYVFDNNSSTNVVCEGYSKAFKYLFDLSQFTSAYDCILATGTMNGGNHMWNIVQMDDGGNYLVDVTNCDSGSTGYPDKLFMVGGPSGSWNSYSFRIGSKQIAYAYNSDTLNTFRQDALTISNSSYTPSVLYTVSVTTADHGTVTASPTQAAEGDTVTLTITPNTGYELDTLTVKKGASNVTVNANNKFTMPAGNVTVTATFKPLTYTITWQNDDGSLFDATTVEYGATPTHDAPSKAATAEYTYSFAGWTPGIAKVTGNATYKATFTATKRSYTITWQNDDGSLFDATTVEYGSTPTHAAPSKASTAEYSYSFAGWTPGIAAVTGDATYKATFTVTKRSYTITWQNDDGSQIDQTTVEYGTVPTHADASKASTAGYRYVFAGWTPTLQTVTGEATYKATYTAIPVFGTASFTLPANTNVIEESAFEGDTSITVVDASHCTSIGANAFKDCTELTKIRLSANCDIAPSAFTNCGTVYVFAPSGGTTQTTCPSNCVFIAEDS